MRAVHHVTYERVGHELLDDLRGVCNGCHEFLSGVSDRDPVIEDREFRAMIARYTPSLEEQAEAENAARQIIALRGGAPS